MLNLLWYIVQLLALLGGIFLTVSVLFELYRSGFLSAKYRKFLIAGITFLLIGLVPVFFTSTSSKTIEMRMAGAYQQMDDPKIVVHLKSDGTFYTNCQNYKYKKGLWTAKNDLKKIALIMLENKQGSVLDELTVDWYDGRLQLRSSSSYLNFVRCKNIKKN